jgi:hypothetical protein
MTTAHDVWTDPELRDLVRTEPELLAVADALASAQGVDARARKRRRLPVRRLGAIAAALAALAVVALIAPWSRSGGDSLSSLALAAIGSQPVLHVVAEVKLPATAELIDIQSGRARPVIEERQQEIWYDRQRGLKHTITRSGATVLDDILETPKGGFTPGGIVYDCAWIAAHPVEATKARVSCNPSGENGTTPRAIPRPKPSVNPALGGFLDGYQKALAEGLAREAGTGELDGRAVVWLEFPTQAGRTEKVALDQESYEPLLVEDNFGRRLRIRSIETIPRERANFKRPSVDALGHQPSFGGPVARLTRELALEPAALAKALPGALWAGPTLDGYSLASAERKVLRTTFANDTRPPEMGVGVELSYRALAPNGEPDRRRPAIHLQESATRQFGYAWGFLRGEPPPEGTLYAPISASDSEVAIGFAVVRGIFVTIHAPSTDLLLEAARSLRPVTP